MGYSKKNWRSAPRDRCIIFDTILFANVHRSLCRVRNPKFEQDFEKVFLHKDHMFDHIRKVSKSQNIRFLNFTPN